jgi:hypothetical protein
MLSEYMIDSFVYHYAVHFSAIDPNSISAWALYNLSQHSSYAIMLSIEGLLASVILSFKSALLGC